MLATMFCVLSGNYHRNNNMKHPCLVPQSREKVYDTYILRYAELLYSWGLLNTRAELNKHLKQKYEQNESKFLPIEEGREEGINLGVSFSCLTCQNAIDPRTNYCQSCRDFAFRCSICETAVKGLFTFCDMCKHGGHLNHLVNWFSNNSFCPTGCGCQCRFSSMLHTKPEIGNQDLAMAIS